MEGASTRRLALLLLIAAAAFAAVPATVLAKPKPTRVRYVVVSHTKGCSVTVNPMTGKVTFKAEKGHYGTCTVVVEHGKNKIVHHFTIKKPKPGQKPSPPVTVVPIPVPGPPGAPGPPGTPAVTPPAEPVPSPIQPVEPPTPPASAPANVAPVLQLNNGVLSWAAQPGASGYKGAISDGPRFTNRTTQYVDLGLNSSWKPQVVPCGETMYYGVASEGNAGDQWVANETAISGPVCSKPLSPYPVTEAGGTPSLGDVNEQPSYSCDNLANAIKVNGRDLCAITSLWGGYGCDTPGGATPPTCPTWPDYFEMAGLCEDIVTVTNYLNPHSTPYWDFTWDPDHTRLGTGFCYAYTGSQYLPVFNEQDIPSGIIAAFAQDVAGIFPYELPVPTDVGSGIIYP